jgi:hypothetical protein
MNPQKIALFRWAAKIEDERDAAVAAIHKHNQECMDLCPASASKAMHCIFRPMAESGRCSNCAMHWIIKWPKKEEEE